jgi:hypothetical protein
MKLIAAGHAHLVSKSSWDHEAPSNCDGGGIFFTSRELVEELFALINDYFGTPCFKPIM